MHSPLPDPGRIDPTTEIGATLAAYELTLSALITTSAQCRALFAELFQAHCQTTWLLQQIRLREQELTAEELNRPLREN